MKCLAVFSTLPDLLFLWADSQFQIHLEKCGRESGILDEQSTAPIEEEMMNSLANHFFSPIVTSNKYMAQRDNPYRSINCDNGFIFCMNEVTFYCK